MIRLFGLLILPVVWLSFPSSANASAVLPEGMAARVRRSHRVVRAKVLGSNVQNVGGNPRGIYTVTRIEVLDTLKGRPAKELEIVQLGGKQGLWELKVAGDVQLVDGEEAVFLLRCTNRALPDRCTLVGLQEGRVMLVNGTEGKGREVMVPREGRKTWAKFADEIRAHAKLPEIQPGSSAAGTNTPTQDVQP